MLLCFYLVIFTRSTSRGSPSLHHLCVIGSPWCVHTSSLGLRQILPTYPSSVFQLHTSLSTFSSGARGRSWPERFTSVLRSFSRDSFSSHNTYSEGFPLELTTCKRVVQVCSWLKALLLFAQERGLTISSSCFAVVFSAILKTVKGSGPGAP